MMLRMPSAGLPLRHRLVLGLLYLFLALEVVASPARFYLAQTGLASLIYLPKLLIVGVVVASALRALYRGRLRPAFAAILLSFMFFALVGWFFTRNPLQPAFGVFALLPLLYAVQAEPALRQMGPRMRPYVALLWCAAALGVAIDARFEVPWAGLVYQLGEAEIQGSREWTTFGVERVAGFARASYEAADQLLLLALPLMFLYRSLILKLAVWLSTGALIYLTTTKKTGGTYLLLTVLLPLMNPAIAPALIRRATTVAVPIAAAAVGIGLPISTFFITYRLDLDSVLSQVLFASFEDRLTVVWPASLDLALERGSAVLGRGIGGIGAAQKHFEPQLFMPGDSFYIYLYVTFGLLAFWFVAAYVASLARLDTQASPWNLMMWALGVAVLLNGWANNGLESPITASMLGITLSYAYAARQRRRATDQPRLGPRVVSAPRRPATP